MSLIIEGAALKEVAFHGACALALLAADRFILKRGRVDITGLDWGGVTADGEYYRFALRYTTSSKLRRSVLEYELRDAKRPTTVISGKMRTLDFARKGDNEEFLLIRKSLVKEPGTWLLSARITTGCSWLNPFYKLFAVEASKCAPFRLTTQEK